ncbi:helix-turn-helix domain-containing protein [Sphingomonas sp. RB56-2]|uniref:Helix-turn-helix domain-containing protein n=2 Tax=Sphingomonas brevis TaxID=2908206 RepID=A0ABT0S6S3_9SPHN|nr:helix-turn-helix domain-containing protein [Sphingomonas brevis]MCL6739837.1 helix-turn-helix domain-containing protein [Sphingomonas brevis]
MLSIKDAVGLLGLGRTTIYKLIGDGQLQAVKIGNRTLVKMASVRSLTQTQN